MKAMEKVNQARYFLREMERVQDNRLHFIYEFSAFLSSCKSVVNYLREELGADWYKAQQQQAQRGKYRHIAYYLRKRDADVHDSLVSPKRLTVLTLEDDALNPQEEVIIVQGDQYGNALRVTKVANTEPDPLTSAPTIPYQASHMYYFDDSESSGKDIVAECHEYVDQLANIVKQAANL